MLSLQISIKTLTLKFLFLDSFSHSLPSFSPPSHYFLVSKPMFKRLVLVLLPNARDSFVSPKTYLGHRFALFTKSFSSKGRNPDEQSFTVSYLMSSCGLPKETALRASRKVHLRSAEGPDSVLTLLRNHGFTDSHISKLVRLRPNVLVSKPEKTILPKLEFFHSLGFPAVDIAHSLSSNPALLESSLNNVLIPVYNYLKGVILLDDKQVRKMLPNAWIFRLNLEKNIVPKIAVLRELGVSTSNLAYILIKYPHVLDPNRKQFDINVKKVVEMGLNPSKFTFVCVLQMVTRTSKSTWEHKIKVYRKCGWSENDFQLAFKKNPLFMSLSAKKIMSVMDFLVNKMGWKPTAIAWVPSVLCFSLEKRIIPRCSVIKVLLLKGLINKNVSVSTVLISSYKYFLGKFVTKYEKDVPHLLDIFSGKVGLAELGFESEEICGRKLS